MCRINETKFPALKRILWTFVLCITLSNSFAHAQEQHSEAEIEKIVRDYLLKNPEIILEALQILERRREQELAEAQQRQISANAQVLYSSDHQVVIGNPNGDVTLVEFFDYNCGYCRQTLATVEQLIEQDPQVKVVLKEFPVLGPGSLEAARVSIAASKMAPEKYKELHVRLLKANGRVNQRIAMAISKELGMDTNKLETLLEAADVEEALGEVQQLASDLGINGTPSFVIGNELIPGAVGLDVLQEKVKAMRQCGQSMCS